MARKQLRVAIQPATQIHSDTAQAVRCNGCHVIVIVHCVIVVVTGYYRRACALPLFWFGLFFS